MKCEICGFEAKNENGLRLHSRKHKEPKVEPVVEPVKEPVIEVKSPEVRIYDKKGGYIRTYNREMHGENFVSLAKGFCEKNYKKGFKMN